MKKYKFIIKDWEDETKTFTIETNEYDEMVGGYTLYLNNGYVSISRNRVISITKLK